MSNRISRRSFIRRAAVVAGGVMFLPRLGRGAVTTTANDRLNVACIGVGGKGAEETNWCGNSNTVNLVAICDTDEKTLGGVAGKFPRAKAYTDYRKMLNEMKEIEAVTVVTADHSHFPAAMMAMQMGRHAYVQKPLTHTIDEARRLAKAAADKKLATQMGNQGHSAEGNRALCEYIWAGAIGPVSEVHAWTDRPIWPQGMTQRPPEKPVPANLHWDEWLGPAPVRPFGDGYHPFKWRGWLDFGCGALGDMGCHIMDGAVWALKLAQADTIKISADTSDIHPDGTRKKGATSRPATLPAAIAGPIRNDETWPSWSIITFEFSARAGMPPCKLVWYDGGKMPPRPKDLEEGRKLDGGSYFVGEKGTILSGVYGGCRIVPEAKHQEYKAPPKTIARSKGTMQDWVIAAKGGPPASSNFIDSAAGLTEVVLLGNVAIRAGGPIEYDVKNMKITNNPEANRFLAAAARKGWDF